MAFQLRGETPSRLISVSKTEEGVNFEFLCKVLNNGFARGFISLLEVKMTNNIN